MPLPLIEQRLQVTPERPGVYLMKDARGSVLYVGKASVLRNRLRTYFGAPSSQANKTRRMMGHVHDFEYIVTDSEAEALILENTLIKRYRPRYNARLKDDKTYPYLKIDLAEEFPKVYITRKVSRDGGRYFGPLRHCWHSTPDHGLGEAAVPIPVLYQDYHRNRSSPVPRILYKSLRGALHRFRQPRRVRQSDPAGYSVYGG